MDTFSPSDDALAKEIAAIEAAISNDNADLAELEALLAQKRQNLHILGIELKALKRAASLRPVGNGSYGSAAASSAAASSNARMAPGQAPAPKPAAPPQAAASAGNVPPAPTPEADKPEESAAEQPQGSRFRLGMRQVSRASDSTFM